jgi:hypothetical protein
MQIAHVLPCKELRPGEVGACWVGLALNPDLLLVTSVLSTRLRCQVVQGSSKYEENYQLEDLEIAVKDYISPRSMSHEAFSAQWEKIAAAPESSVYQLSFKNAEVAQKELQQHFGGYRIYHDEKQEGKQVLLLSGRYLADEPFLLRILIGMDSQKGCIVNIKAKSGNKDLSAELVSSLE